MVELLLVSQLLQSLYCDGRRSAVRPVTLGYYVHVGATVPDPHSLPFHLGFATEGACVLGVLALLNLLHHFPEGGAITGPIFGNDSYLLDAFTHVAAN